MKNVFKIVLLLVNLTVIPTYSLAGYPGECVVLQVGIRAGTSYNNYDYRITAFNESNGAISQTKGAYNSGTMNTYYYGLYYYENGNWFRSTFGYQATLQGAGNYPGYENRYAGDDANMGHNRDIPPIGNCDRCPDPNEIMIDGVCVEPCLVEKTQKQFDCGGGEHWDDSSLDLDTCVSKCKCEDIGTTYVQIKEFCEGNKNTSFVHDEINCIGECAGDCTYEYNSLERECGIQGIDTWDQATCTGTCKDNCQTEIAILETDCGASGVNFTTYNYDACTGDCRQDCTAEYNALETKCGILGIGSWDDDTCQGICKNCKYEHGQCSRDCSGFIADFDCRDIIMLGQYTGIETGECICVPEDERFLDAAVGVDSGYGLDPTDNAGTFGGTVTENPDGSKTETFEDGSTIIYNAPSGDRPNGSTVYTLANGSMQEHYVDGDGNKIVLAYDNETGQATETIEQVVDGVTITTTSVVEDFTPDQDGSNVGEQTTAINEGDTTTPGTETSEETTVPYVAEGDSNDMGRISFAPLTIAVAQFGNKYPFAIVHNLTTLVDKINVSPVTPSWTIDLIPDKWGGTPFVVELSAFDGLAEVIRWFLALGLWAVAIWSCIKIWTR